MGTMRLWKSIYLMVGTAIGAGILAIPVSTVQSGFFGSTSSLFICWLFMTISAYYMLEVRLWFKGDIIDLSTMTGEILGRSGEWATKFFYLLLLFALISVYIIVGSAWISETLEAAYGLGLNEKALQVAFTIAAAVLIYSGISKVAFVNQLVTFLVLTMLGVIIALSITHVDSTNLATHSIDHMPGTFPLLITAFGFSIVIPSLAPYLDHSKSHMRKALLFSCLLILLAYVFWVLISFGVIGNGVEGLGRFAASQDKGTEVINDLQRILQAPMLKQISSLFIISAVLSSLFGVGQCLYHYLQDIISMENRQLAERISISLSFGIPLAVVIFYPAGISQILGFAGIFVAVILGMIPVIMYMAGAKERVENVRFLTYRFLPVVVLAFFSFIIFIEVSNIAKNFGF